MTLASSLELLSSADNPEETVIAWMMLEEFFQHLSEREKLILQLRLQEMSYPEIAEMTGFTLKSVDMTLVRIRTKWQLFVTGQPIPRTRGRRVNSGLSSLQEQALQLRLEGKSYREIVEATGCSPKAVYSILSTARRKTKALQKQPQSP